MTICYKDLYIANNIEGLRVVAKDKVIKDVGSTFGIKCNNLERLYKEAQENLIDQEKAYIFLYRFLFLYERYSSLIKDKKFMNIRFSKQLERSKKQFEQLEKELIRRYSEKDATKENKSPNKLPTSLKPLKKFPNDSISCGELYSALKDDNNNILLVDARSKEDFVKSNINFRNVMNVPDEVIRSGLSANSIDIPSEYKAMWDKRDSFDIMILFDWDSSLETMKATKLEKLLSSLVDWDPNRNYAQKPIILNGGYLEWAQQYPSLCNNPNFAMNHLYNDLDELLDLDVIQYPDESKPPIMMFQEPSSASDEQEMSDNENNIREELIRKNRELTIQSDQLLDKLIEEERKWDDSWKDDHDQSEEIEKTISNLNQQFYQVADEKNKIQEQFEFYAPFDPTKESFEQDQIKEIADIDKSEKEKYMICQTMAQQRIDALNKARALKPKAAGDNNSASSSVESNFTLPGGKEKPTVNRANKPFSITAKSRIFDEIKFNPAGSGLVGLKNIRNTCYMNTVVQCLRNIPELASLFCTGVYRKHIGRTPDAIIMETASLVRTLWSNLHQTINPIEFYEKVCLIEPNYRLGNHEDCMEFFLFLLNNLSEDCAIDLPKPTTMSPAQQAWFNQLGGKFSIFINLFYHQIKITQSCQNCKKTTHKFEMESTFMLPVPDDDFKIEDLMRNYLRDDIIDDYCCSKCKRPVTNSKQVWQEPKILVIILKRYKQIIRNNTVSVSKIDSKVYFPISNFRLREKTYHLNSIALHSGTVTSGHYTAACFTNKKWYEFNDEIVRPINIDDDPVRTKACAFFYSTDL